MSEKLRLLRRATLDAHKKYGDEPLLRLESIQTELFIHALASWEAGRDPGHEIEELAGDLLDKAEKSSWLQGERRFVASDRERRTLFRVRWADLTGLRSLTAFSPGANEWRIYYRFLLAHPEHGRNLHAAAEEQLAYVAAVEKVDLDFPGAFARGVLFYRLGSYDKSADAFRGFLSRHPTGAWRLRAQNHLAAAAAHAMDREPDL